MLQLNPRRAWILPVLALFLAACNPVKQGFSHLKAGRQPAAKQKFERAMPRPDQAPAAGFGLYKIREPKVLNGEYPPMQAAFQELQGLAMNFDSLPAAKKKYYARQKKIDLSGRDFRAAAARLQGKALLLIEAKNDLLLLDSFFFNMSPIAERLQYKYEAVEDSLVMKNLRSDDYEVLRSIAKNHRHVLEKRRLRITPTFNHRLLRAFLREYPLSAFRQFTEDFPGHWAAADCFSEPFLNALESRQLADLMSFFSTCPQSNTDQVAVYGLVFPVNNYLAAQVEKLNPDDRRRWEELLLTTHWINEGLSDIATPDLIVAKAKELIREAAPANRSYRLLVRAMDELANRKAWSHSDELIRFAKPFFLDDDFSECAPAYIIYNKRQVWFDRVIERLQAPTENPPFYWLDPINDNSPNASAPIVSVDDARLLFASNRGRKAGGLNIYAAEKLDTSWSAGAMSRALSRKSDDTPLALTAEQDLALVLVDTLLYLSKRNGVSGKWGRPKLVSSDLRTLAWVGAGTLSRDGAVLIFEGATQPRAIENEYNIDLYIMRFDPAEGRWSAPERMRSGVNTLRQERTPFLHADGKTLLFSTEGHYGFDGFDAFMTVRQDTSWRIWSPPANLGKEVNSYRDDFEEKFSLPASGKKVYLASNNDGAWPDRYLQERHLPTYGRPTRVLVMRGKVDYQTNRTRIKAQDAFPTGGRTVDSCRVRNGGDFQLLLPDEGRDKVFLFADDPKIYSTVQELDLREIPDVSELAEPPITIPIGKMIAEEIPVPLQHARFDRGSTELNATLRQELDWMAHYFRDKPGRTLLVGGFSDREGDAETQEALSLARAEHVKAYLIEQGLPWDRIWTQGFSDKKNREGEDNRRVEVYIK